MDVPPIGRWVVIQARFNVLVLSAFQDATESGWLRMHVRMDWKDGSRVSLTNVGGDEHLESILAT